MYFSVVNHCAALVVKWSLVLGLDPAIGEPFDQLIVSGDAQLVLFLLRDLAVALHQLDILRGNAARMAVCCAEVSLDLLVHREILESRKSWCALFGGIS